MTVALTTAPAGLFTRSGVLIRLMAHLNGIRSGVGPAPVGATSGSAFWGSPGPEILDLDTQANAIFNQFLSTDKDILGTFWPMIANLRTNVGALLPQMGQIVIANLVRMVNDDTGGGYTDPQQALPVLIAQMTTASASVNANNVGSTVTAGSNTGNAILVCSTTNYDGTTLQHVFPETLTALTYNADTAGAERLAVTGPAQVADSLDYLWPGGSGCNRSITVVTSSDNAGGNLLTNSGFETFTVANTPDNWELLVATVGTTLFSNAVQAYRGSKSIKITGTGGAQLTSIAQKFNDASYTLGTLAADTVYQFSAWVYLSAVPSTGVLAFSLINASNATITDDAGTSQIVSTALTSGISATTWTNIKGTLRTPATLPSAVKLRIHMTTAIESAKSVSIDNVTFTPATQLYAGGPFVSVHRGATDLVVNDRYTIAVTNDYEGIFQTWFNRIFDMRNRGFQLPSKANGTETISDTLTQ